MNNWQTQKINIGKVRVGKMKKVIFKPLKELLEIKNLKVSCDCSKPYYDKKNKHLIINYTPGPIPKHLKLQKHYSTTQKITITYIDESKDILSFMAKVYDRY